MLDARLTDLTWTFVATDDHLIECMTCGVVGEVGALEIRAVHVVPSPSADEVDRSIVDFACPVCRTRGSALVA